MSTSDPAGPRQTEKAKGAGQGARPQNNNIQDTLIFAQLVVARERSCRDVLAELNDAERRADSSGRMSGPMRSEQPAASARTYRTHAALDRLAGVAR